MKLITRTLTNPQTTGFMYFRSYQWHTYNEFLEQHHVNRSVSFHDDGKVMYIVEICKDEDLDGLEQAWEDLMKRETLAKRNITATWNIENAFDKK